MNNEKVIENLFQQKKEWLELKVERMKANNHKIDYITHGIMCHLTQIDQTLVSLVGQQTAIRLWEEFNES